MKSGYKQTEIGTFPDVWQVIPLQDLCIKNGIVRGPFGGALKKEIFVAEGYKVYEQGNAIYRTINRGSYYVDAAKYQEMIRFAVQEGDFIVSCSGTIGMIFQIPANAPKGIINQALLKLTIDNELVNHQYFYLFFSCDSFNKRIVDDTQGGAMKNLVGMEVFRNTLFPIPPMAEQENIGNALMDTNRFITKLEGLVIKKKAIKQGAMQELLTGKRRLPGFSGEWHRCNLGSLGVFIKGMGISRNQSNSGKLPAVRYGELYTRHQNYITNYFSHISEEIASNAQRVSRGDILFAASGETKEEIGKCAAIIHETDVYAGGDILIFRPTTQLDPVFMGTLLNTADACKQRAEKGQGDAVVHIHADALSSISIMIPDIKEQRLIADILVSMDKEIELLESKLKKYRQVKQGMMQQLLTGKIRLV